MKIAIIYATTEGQTRKIARFAADCLVAEGNSVELIPAAECEGLDLSRFDAAILAGSVHMQRFQKELVAAAKAMAPALANLKTLFLAVSLAAAGDDKKDRAELDRIAADFSNETGWAPGRVCHVAGAFRFTQYDFFKSWAMRWIAAQKGQEVDPHADREYTDWAALKALVTQWSMAPAKVTA